MKLKLNKKKLKNLSRDSKALPSELTPQVGGAGDFYTPECAGTYSRNDCPSFKYCPPEEETARYC